MASADLDHIRALLIAQSVEPEPRRALFGGFGRRRSPPTAPLTLGPAAQVPPRPAAPAPEPDDQELLLSYICPAAPPPEPQPFTPEALSPLPPPSTRADFGRRPDGVGEERTQLQREAVETAEVPYFAEDLASDAAELETLFAEPEPLRPWIKTLRAPEEVQEPQLQAVAPTCKAKAGRCTTASALARDLLEALELALTREHQGLDDQLMALAA